MKFNTILKKYIVRSSDGTIKVFNLNFLGVALAMLLCFLTVIYKVVTTIDENKDALIENTAASLFKHVQNLEEFNTVLKTNVDYHTYALTIFQSNPYVLNKNTDVHEVQQMLQYFSKAAANKTVTKQEYQNINSLVLNKQDKTAFPKVADLEQLENASLLGSYLKLEFFKSKVMVIEANFVKEILTLTDSVGNPLLPPYYNQQQYDKVTNDWLSKAAKLISKYEEDMDTVATVVELFMQNNTPKFRVNHPLYTYRDIMQVSLLNACRNSTLLAMKDHF